MGRSTQPKSAPAIQLPHDGPLSQGGPIELDGVALEFYQKLQQAEFLREQLQALQAFKSTLLQRTKAAPDIDFAALTLRRSLLEWSLSCETPMALQRAIQSCLMALESALPDDDVQETVVNSLWQSPSPWKNPLKSLQEALNFSPTQRLIVQDENACLEAFNLLETIARELQSTLTVEKEEGEGFGRLESLMIQRGIHLAAILRTLLTGILAAETKLDNSLFQLQPLHDFLWFLLGHDAMTTEGRSVVSVAYGRVLFWEGDPRHRLEQTRKQILESNWSISVQLSLYQGITATVPPQQFRTSIQETLVAVFLEDARHAADPNTRLAAIKGLHTLVTRCCCETTNSASTRSLIKASMEVVLQTWESPPSRKLGNTVPALFQLLIGNLEETDHVALTQRILAQPPNRKGKYLALEALVPLVGAARILQWSNSKEGNGLVDSLLSGIGDRGHNAGAIADLWAKIMFGLLQEQKRTAGIKKKKRQNHKEQDDLLQAVLPAWTKKWAPQLARALVSQPTGRRKQVASFCLPRIINMVGGASDRHEAACAFGSLLYEVDSRYTSVGDEDLAARVLWAKLEISRIADKQKLVKASPELARSIVVNVPLDDLKVALIHSSLHMRMVAFQGMHSIAAASRSSPSQQAEMEVELWKHALPYAIKNDNKEFVSTLMQCLSELMERLSTIEASSLDKPTTPQRTEPPILKTFVTCFLVNDLVLRRGAYPGTVGAKETVILSLLECILSFLTQERTRNSRLILTTDQIINRRRKPCEVATGDKVIRGLFSCEVFATMISLLHSTWDNTRSGAYRFLIRLLEVGRTRNISCPEQFASQRSRCSMEARGVYLASSPRQREADTGARMLAFIYLSIRDAEERDACLTRLIDLSEIRVATMQDKLGKVLQVTANSTEATQLPLAHGLIQSIRLILELIGNSRQTAAPPFNMHSGLYERMISLFCRALQISLSVVADVRDGEVIDGVDYDILNIGAQNDDVDKCGTAQLNVNTGAIGANGTFSSVTPKDSQEALRRQAMQRVVVGSWLLTKETCAVLATLITTEVYNPQLADVEKAGALLISTLAALKHQGAAFAAHKSLQKIASSCFSRSDGKLEQLPSKWANRLLEEISVSDKVRDSTLRRSTGYALGFLSIMRSEIASKIPPHSLCFSVLTSILKLSLPRRQKLLPILSNLEVDVDAIGGMGSLFPSLVQDESETGLDEGLEERSRVHALNILRLAILDAPLVSEIAPLAGEAIVSAVIGYVDSNWAVRNSSTMVFSAVMLRVVDADKNASNSDVTSSKAISADELFRCYPSLKRFLLSVVQTSTMGQLKDTVHSPLFPILILLSRVQPLTESGVEALQQMEPFIPAVLKGLKSPHHGTRAAAARAMANLSSCAGGVAASASTLMEKCLDALKVDSRPVDWNAVDGALLGIQSLVRSLSASHLFVKESKSRVIAMDILNFLQLSVKGCFLLCPPPCLTTALDTLTDIASRSTCSWHTQLEEISRNLIETLPSSISSEAIPIGASRLGGAAATAVCKLTATRLWDPSLSDVELRSLSGNLIYLFESNVVGVRVACVKSFKKSIYGSIDTLLEDSNASQDAKAAVLVAIASSILEALRFELHRDDDPDETIGRHPPTVRRLSRCFLECAGGYQRLFHGKPDFSKFVSHSELWDVSLEMSNNEIGLSSAFGNKDCVLLDGNAVELMSIAVASALVDSNTGVVSMARSFEASIRHLNTPMSSWRVRYCVANAVGNCQILAWGAGSSQEKAWEPLLFIQQELLLQSTQMLQDSDVDVRTAAGKAVLQFSAPIETMGPKKSKEYLTLVPEFVLEQAYNGSCFGTSRNRGLTRLWILIVDSCKDLRNVLLEVNDDMSVTREADSTIGLLNTGTKRKIFEDEDPNPFEEKCLTVQLAVRTLVSQRNSSFDGQSRVTTQLRELCLYSLSFLQKSKSKQGEDLVHSFTRCSSVFSALHGLILGCCAAIFLGGQSWVATQDMAAELVRQPDASIHPAIMEVINAMAKAGAGDTNTFESINNCCFLLNPE